MALYPEPIGERDYRDTFNDTGPTAAPPMAAPAPVAEIPPQAQPAPQKQTPAAPDDGYSMGHAIVDALSQKLGFGTPIRNVQQMRMMADADKRADARAEAQLERERRMEREGKALQHTMRYVASVGKNTSPYYKDATHLVEGINANPDAQAMVGGRLKATKLDEKDRAGDDLFQVDTMDLKTGNVVGSVKASTPELINRFFAGVDPGTTMQAMRKLEENQDKEARDVAKFQQLLNADPATKVVHGIKLTPIENYIYMKGRYDAMPADQKPQLHDWQLQEMAGIKQDKGWKHVGRLVPMEDGTLGSIQINERTGEERTIKIKGSSWKEHKEKTEDFSKKYLEVIWPKHKDMTRSEEQGRGMMQALLLSEKDPNRRRLYENMVLPEFQDWVERSGGEAEDEAGAKREMTSGDLRAKLNELVDKHTGKEKPEKPQPTAAADDGGGWAAYLKPSPGKEKTPNEKVKKPAMTAAGIDLPAGEPVSAPQARQRMLKMQQDLEQGEAERAQQEAQAAAEREAARKKRVQKQMQQVIY